MNKKRRMKLGVALKYLTEAMYVLDTAISSVDELLSSTSDIIDGAYWEESDCLGNMPENLESSERYEKMENAVDNLSDAGDNISDSSEMLSKAAELVSELVRCLNDIRYSISDTSDYVESARE